MHGGEEADQLCHAGAIAGAPSSNSETHGTAALESSLPARLDHIRDLHAASKLLQCHRVLTTTDHHLPPLPRSPSLSHIRRTCAESAAFYAALTDPDPARPWTPAYAGPDARVFHRGEEDGACELKVEGVVHAPVMALMGMVYEVELYGDVFGFVKGVEVLAETGEMEKAVRVGFAAPWPLAGREMAAFAYAVDDLDEGGAVVVVLRDVREGDVGRDGAQVEVPEAERGTVVRMEVRFAVMELRPQSATETDLKMMICVDPKLAFMPLAFVNWAARSVFRFSLRILESKSQNLSDEHRKRMESRPVYGHIRQRVRDFLARQSIEFREDEKVDPRHRSSFDSQARAEAPSRSVMLKFLGFR